MGVAGCITGRPRRDRRRRIRRLGCGSEARASARTDGSKTGRARLPAEYGQSGTPRHSCSVRLRHPSRWILVIAYWYSSESPSRRFWRHVDTPTLARADAAVIHASVELRSVERIGLGASSPRAAYVALHHLLESPPHPGNEWVTGFPNVYGRHYVHRTHAALWASRERLATLEEADRRLQ